MGYLKSSIGAIKNIKGNPLMGIMAGYTLVEPAIDIAYSRSQGHSMASSIGRGAATYLTWELFPGLGAGLLAKDLAQAGVQFASKMSDISVRQANSTYRHQFGGNFVDTQAAYTMRQRGLSAIQNNGINARSVLGNEARMYSRGHYE